MRNAPEVKPPRIPQPLRFPALYRPLRVVRNEDGDTLELREPALVRGGQGREDYTPKITRRTGRRLGFVMWVAAIFCAGRGSK
jgi:hypothetical protein